MLDKSNPLGYIDYIQTTEGTHMLASNLSATITTDFGDHYVETRVINDVEVSQVIWKDIKIIGSVIFGDHGRYCLKIRRSFVDLTYLVFDAHILEKDENQIKKFGCNAKMIRATKSWQDAIKDLEEISEPIFEPGLKAAKVGDFVWKFNELWKVVAPRMKCATREEFARLNATKRECKDGRVLVQRVFDAGTSEGFFLAMSLTDSITLTDSYTYDEWYE